MKPFLKWQGGKRRELDHIRPYIPSNVTNISEPFCGGAAVAFDREGNAFTIERHSGSTTEGFRNIRYIVRNKRSDMIKFTSLTSLPFKEWFH